MKKCAPCWTCLIFSQRPLRQPLGDMRHMKQNSDHPPPIGVRRHPHLTLPQQNRQRRRSISMTCSSVEKTIFPSSSASLEKNKRFPITFSLVCPNQAVHFFSGRT